MRFLEVLIRLSLLFLVLESATGQLAKSGCQYICGNISIPYPFGIGTGCYLERAFSVACSKNQSKPLVSSSGLPLHDISLQGSLRVSLKASYNCNKNNTETDSSDLLLNSSQFVVSNTRNKLMAIGCDGSATLFDPKTDQNLTSCGTICSSATGVTQGSSCNGYGCCEVPIPISLMGFRLTANSHSIPSIRDLFPCNYAFLVENDTYNFVFSDILTVEKNREYPVVLEWSVGQRTCEEAKANQDSYACKSRNSVCIDPEHGPGYRCNCTIGYSGNPYLPNGCQDVNECEDFTLNECIRESDCRNNEGGYTCVCPKGQHGDGKTNGTGCITDQPIWKKLVFGSTVGLFLLSLGVSLVYWTVRQKRIAKQREKLFEQNGGLFLKQRLAALEQTGEQPQVFSAEDLKNATDNYHESRILGKGGQGTVYKGILQDNRKVAIKRALIGDYSQIEEFINEVIVLSQINHRNVVKLLGCCLETEVPLLVYECMNNGALFDHMHDSSRPTFISWKTRLKIAIETANAISYLHSAASIPIIHRDIKSANILLGNSFTAKVSDFGASRLMPADQEQLTTLVRGTLGYLDPEYFQTSHLNEKSDVYSFGVVLLELLSGKKALCFDRITAERNLVNKFVSAMNANRLVEILDERVLKPGNLEQLQRAVDLAMRCLRLKGEERPTMKEVAVELEVLAGAGKQTL